MKYLTTKIVCASSTQTDYTNVQSTGIQTDHEMTKTECSIRVCDTGTREITDKTEPGLTVTRKEM